MEQLLQNLTQKFNDLEQLFLQHMHKGFDKSKVLPSATIYGGQVDFSGNAIYLPDGWTCSRLGAGQIRVVHNMGTVKYACVANPTDDYHFTRMVITSNNFQVIQENRSGNLEDSGITFILYPLP